MQKSIVKNSQIQNIVVSQKVCLKCGVEKPLSEYHRKKCIRDGYNTRCKSCIKLDGIVYREKNKEVIKEKKRKYNLDNAVSIKEKRKKYYIKNKECIKAKSIKYFRENKENINLRNIKKRETNPNFLLSDRLRTRLNRAIKAEYKAGSAVRDLGCSIAFFKSYIESKFEQGMSWSNRKNWHLDHIVPLSYFDLSNREEFLQACHYTNYQPLFGPDNISKGDKLPVDAPCKWFSFRIRRYTTFA
jgi:hypothetical protein